MGEQLSEGQLIEVAIQKISEAIIKMEQHEIILEKFQEMLSKKQKDQDAYPQLSENGINLNIDEQKEEIEKIVDMASDSSIGNLRFLIMGEKNLTEELKGKKNKLEKMKAIVVAYNELGIEKEKSNETDKEILSLTQEISQREKKLKIISDLLAGIQLRKNNRQQVRQSDESGSQLSYVRRAGVLTDRASTF
jgi:hypothetical protein